MFFEDKVKLLLNIAEMHYYADAIGEYIDRMFIEVVMVDSIPYVRVHHVMLSDFEAHKMLHYLEQKFPDEDGANDEGTGELRWKSGVIMDQVQQAILTSDFEEGGNNGIGRHHE
jgi:hypothetical protein